MAYSDRIYRSVVTFFQFFSRGWGPVETYEQLTNTLSFPPFDRSVCRTIVADHSHPVTVKKVTSDKSGSSYEGAFLSPLATYLPGVLPKESEIVRFELVVPKAWRSNTCKPVYIHLAGTGDHFFWRRRHMFAYPLLKHHGIGSLMIENPYYGSRKPRYQTRSQLHYVSDLFVMGLALILESMVLGKWLENIGMGPVGLTGLSMGGYNVTLTTSLWPKPVAAVPCLSWASASSVFTKGALSSAVRWDVLEEELFYTKLGHNNRMRQIFDFVAEKQKAVSEIRFPSVTNEREEPSNHSHLPELSNLKQKTKNSRTSGKQLFQPKPETVQMLIWMLDFMTHLNSYPRPISPELVVFVVAKDDMYAPRSGLTDVRDLWPDCGVRMIDGGHISSHFRHRAKLVQAQVDTMDRFLFTRNESQSLADVPSLNS